MKNFTGNKRFQNKANPLLSKPRHFTDRKTVKSIYHAIFKPHLSYSSLIWPQNSNSIKRLFALQKKSLQIIYFQNYIAHTSLFREPSPVKLPLHNWFTLSHDFHTYNTRRSNLGYLVLYERNSVNIIVVYTWNYLQKLDEKIFFYQS